MDYFHLCVKVSSIQCVVILNNAIMCICHSFLGIILFVDLQNLHGVICNECNNIEFKFLCYIVNNCIQTAKIS